jgi:hypothetical protein
MADEQALATTDTPPQTPMPLVALTVTEMVAAQNALSEWCEKKLDQVNGELKDALANVKLAKSRKWKSAPFESLATRIRGQIKFYEKVKIAVEHGYLVVPNLPVDAFAVRVSRDEPADTVTSSWHEARTVAATSNLAAGEGAYVSNEANTKTIDDGTDDTGRQLVSYFPTNYREIAFPVAIAKPRIIDATQQAMELRVFDRIGLVGGRGNETAARGDPIVVGQIFRKRGWGEQTLTFFIAWWFNWEHL